MNIIRIVSIVALLSLGVSACGSPPAPPPPTATKPVDEATAGSLSGRVTFTGQPPAPETVRMTLDKACVAGSGPNPQSDAVVVAADGGLKDAFVYVKDGLDPAYAFPIPSSPAVLDQRGCLYTPRVVGVRAGQTLEILNSDATMHNVHAMPMTNQDFNQGMAVKDTKMTHTFTAPEVMVRFKCNVHPWMSAFVGVVAHPFFAVTDATGAFSFKGLPPGTYTIEAWHERFGKRTATITVAAKQSQTASFTFANAQGRP
jgi:plastocyanin